MTKTYPKLPWGIITTEEDYYLSHITLRIFTSLIPRGQLSPREEYQLSQISLSDKDFRVVRLIEKCGSGGELDPLPLYPAIMPVKLFAFRVRVTGALAKCVVHAQTPIAAIRWYIFLPGAVSTT